MQQRKRIAWTRAASSGDSKRRASTRRLVAAAASIARVRAHRGVAINEFLQHKQEPKRLILVVEDARRERVDPSNCFGSAPLDNKLHNLAPLGQLLIDRDDLRFEARRLIERDQSLRIAGVCEPRRNRSVSKNAASPRLASHRAIQSDFSAGNSTAPMCRSVWRSVCCKHEHSLPSQDDRTNFELIFQIVDERSLSEVRSYRLSLSLDTDCRKEWRFDRHVAHGDAEILAITR